jgi:hypothetical protein
VHRRVDRPLGPCWGLRGRDEGADEGVEASLGGGAGERMGVGLVAVLGAPGLDVAPGLALDELLEDDDDLGRSERVAARRSSSAACSARSR